MHVTLRGRKALVLVVTGLGLATAAHGEASDAPRLVSKCVVHGITTYSDHGCPEGTALPPLALRPEPGGQLLAQHPSPAITSLALRRARCDAARAELLNIDALTDKGQPPEMQAFLDARRQEKKNEMFLYRC